MEKLDIKSIDKDQTRSPPKSKELSPYSKPFFMSSYSDIYGLSPHSRPFIPKDCKKVDTKEYLKKSVNNNEHVIDYNNNKNNK